MSMPGSMPRLKSFILFSQDRRQKPKRFLPFLHFSIVPDFSRKIVIVRILTINSMPRLKSFILFSQDRRQKPKRFLPFLHFSIVPDFSRKIVIVRILTINLTIRSKFLTILRIIATKKSRFTQEFYSKIFSTCSFSLTLSANEGKVTVPCPETVKIDRSR